MARTPRAKPAAPKLTTVLLVRHGQTATTGKVLPGRARGLHLADTGREQAQRAATRIAELPAVAAVYCSPLERTRETAAPIAAARGLKAVPVKGLLEADFGEWTGAELKSLFKLPEWRTVQQAPSSFRFPGGESFTEMQARIVTALDEVSSLDQDRILRALVALVMASLRTNFYQVDDQGQPKTHVSIKLLPRELKILPEPRPAPRPPRRDRRRDHQLSIMRAGSPIIAP